MEEVGIAGGRLCIDSCVSVLIISRVCGIHFFKLSVIKSCPEV